MANGPKSNMHKEPAVVFKKAAQRYCRKKAQEVVDHIRNDGHCPIDTGDLINGYRVEYAHGGGAVVVTNVEYWKFVEFGTRDMEAQPHVRPAYEEVARRSKSDSFGATSSYDSGFAEGHNPDYYQPIRQEGPGSD